MKDIKKCAKSLERVLANMDIEEGLRVLESLVDDYNIVELYTAGGGEVWWEQKMIRIYTTMDIVDNWEWSKNRIPVSRLREIGVRNAGVVLTFYPKKEELLDYIFRYDIEVEEDDDELEKLKIDDLLEYVGPDEIGRASCRERV